MQQATQLKDQPKADPNARALPGNAPGTSFVINLCSSTSPVALSPPDHAGLKRFTFFVSRRREEGRERFRLHMGYFQTQEEAEKLLDIVREIYPGAWAGLAPGQRLRAAAAATHAGAAPIEQEVPPVAAQAAQPPAPVAAVEATVEQPALQPVAQAIVAKPSNTAAPAAGEVVSFEVIPDRGRQVTQTLPDHKADTKADPKADTKGAASEHEAAARSLNDVRAAIASLEDTNVRAPVLRPIPELKPPANIPTAKPIAERLIAERPIAERQVAPKQVEAAPKPIEAKPVEVFEELSDEGAMAVLEEGAKAAANKGKGAPVAGKPGTEAAPATEKAVYAVQLMWSVQPIDITQVPQLAIFSAYTLYGAEGNRDGRRWYGLRLGFFTDAVSAKQVAHYVRSEFSTVSVVPVTMREKERAKLASTRPGDAPAATATPATPASATTPVKAAAPAKPGQTTVSTTQFEFIEDKPVQTAGAAKTPGARPPMGPRTGRGAPGKRAKLRNPAQAAARAKPKKLTLEETLEILGAGDLKMDDGKGPLLNTDATANAAPVRPEPSKSKPSRLGRLFERLSERIGS